MKMFKTIKMPLLAAGIVAAAMIVPAAIPGSAASARAIAPADYSSTIDNPYVPLSSFETLTFAGDERDAYANSELIVPTATRTAVPPTATKTPRACDGDDDDAAKTPKMTKTPKATKTPKMTRTPKATKTPKMMRTPKATKTPEPGCADDRCSSGRGVAAVARGLRSPYNAALDLNKDGKVSLADLKLAIETMHNEHC